jgi:glutamate-ammonia-ligase adenylyltransferase
VHAAARPEVLDQNTVAALTRLEGAGLLPAPAAEVLLPAAQLLNNLTQILRLCLDEPFDPARAPDGLKSLLVRSGEAPDFARLEADLAAREAEVTALFEALVA